MRALALVVWMVMACGGHPASPDAAPLDASVDAPPDAQSYPAFPIYQPPVLRGMGPVMSNVRVVPIYYSDEASITQIDAFLAAYAASPYWPQQVGEYGVAGALTVAPHILLPDPAPPTITDTAIQLFLQTQLDGTHPEWGAVDPATLASTIYQLHIPGTTQGIGPAVDGFHSCTQFGAYHFSVPLTATPGAPTIIYAVDYECTNTLLPVPFDQYTANLVHELVEAATDPVGGTGFGAFLIADARFTRDYGGEVGDMCELSLQEYVKPVGLDYYIQRTYSNAAALAGTDPCVPAIVPAHTYFGAIPVDIGLAPITFGTMTYMTTATTLAMGTSATVDVRLFSNGPMAPWFVDAIDDAAYFHQFALLDLSLDRGTGQNGDVAKLTISIKRKPANHLAGYRVRSQDATTQYIWFGLVYVP